MTAEEAAAITVDAGQIAEALPRVMAEHGVAIIANVARTTWPHSRRPSLPTSTMWSTRRPRTRAVAPSAMPPPSSRPRRPQCRPRRAAALARSAGRRALLWPRPARRRFAWQARAAERPTRLRGARHRRYLRRPRPFLLFPWRGAGVPVNPSWPHVDLNTCDSPCATATASASAGGRSTRASSTAGARSRSARPPRSCGRATTSSRATKSRRRRRWRPPLFDDRERHRPRGALRSWRAGRPGRASRCPRGAAGLVVAHVPQGWSGGPRLAHPLWWSPRAGAPPQRATAR